MKMVSSKANAVPSSVKMGPTNVKYASSNTNNIISNANVISSNTTTVSSSAAKMRSNEPSTTHQAKKKNTFQRNVNDFGIILTRVVINHIDVILAFMSLRILVSSRYL